MKRFTARQYEELIGAQHEVCPAQQAAEERSTVVIPSAAKDLALRIFKKIRRARSFAPLWMTTVERFSAACEAPPSDS